MPRATNGPASHRRKKRIFKQTKGFVGGRKNLLRTAKETLNRALSYAFRDRRVKKREFRNWLRSWAVKRTLLLNISSEP